LYNSRPNTKISSQFQQLSDKFSTPCCKKHKKSDIIWYLVLRIADIALRIADFADLVWDGWGGAVIGLKKVFTGAVPGC